MSAVELQKPGNVTDYRSLKWISFNLQTLNSLRALELNDVKIHLRIRYADPFAYRGEFHVIQRKFDKKYVYITLR